MANPPIDFDAALAEAEGESSPTFAFRFLGKDWELPTSPPAKNMLKMRRIYMRVAELADKIQAGTITEAEANAVVESGSTYDVSEMLGLMVGPETVDAWLEAEATDAQLVAVMKYLWRHYNGMSAEGEALPPANRGERRAKAKSTRSGKSSPDGISSRPISSGSTGSKSAKP